MTYESIEFFIVAVMQIYNEEKLFSMIHFYLSMCTAMPIILAHIVRPLPELGAQLDQFEEVKPSLLVKSFILGSITEHNKVSGIYDVCTNNIKIIQIRLNCDYITSLLYETKKIERHM